MIDLTFSPDEVMKPLTMKQFEDLTNEILVKVNAIMEEKAVDGNYMAGVVMSSLHSFDAKKALFSKQALLENCIHRISCSITYHAVDEISKKLKAQSPEPPADDDETPLATITPINGAISEQH